MLSSCIVDPTYYFGCGGWNRAGHKCYIFYDSPKTTWSDARTRCQSIGSDLLKVENMDEKVKIITVNRNN